MNFDEDEAATNWLREVDPDYIPPFLALSATDTEVYPRSLLSIGVGGKLTAASWWKIAAKKC